jgi:hypothetical protein
MVDRAETRRQHQFGLSKLLLWTVAWAVLLGLLRSLQFPPLALGVVAATFATLLAVRFRWGYLSALWVGAVLTVLNPLTFAILAMILPSYFMFDFGARILGLAAALLVLVPILFLFMYIAESCVNWTDEWIRRKTEVRDDQTP